MSIFQDIAKDDLFYLSSYPYDIFNYQEITDEKYIPLLTAIKNNQLDIVSILLESSDINLNNKNILLYTFLSKNTSLYELIFLNSKVNINLPIFNGLSILNLSIFTCNYELFLILLKKDNLDLFAISQEINPLFLKSGECLIPISDILNTRNFLFIYLIFSKTNYNINKYFIYDKINNTPILSYAISTNNILLFNLILLFSPDLNLVYYKNGIQTNVLCEAIKTHNYYMVDKILSQNCHINDIYIEFTHTIISPLNTAIILYMKYASECNLQKVIYEIILLLFNDKRLIISDYTLYQIIDNDLLLLVQSILDYYDNEKLHISKILTYSFICDKLDILKLILSSEKINVNYISNGCPLNLALLFNNVEIINLLLSNPKLDINSYYSFHFAIVNDIPIEIIRSLSTNPKLDINLINLNGYTPLELSIYTGNDDVTNLLLADPRINLEINYPLHFAIRKNNMNVITHILSKNPELINKDNLLITCLDEAAKYDNIEIFDYLFNHPKLNLNITNPLYFACSNNSINIVKKLISIKSVDVNKISISGRTPLNIAIKNENIEVVKLLLRRPDIDINKENIISHNFPLSLACSNEEIMNLILDHQSLNINKINNSNETCFTTFFGRSDNLEVIKKFLNINHLDIFLKNDGNNIFDIDLLDNDLNKWKIIVNYLEMKNIDIITYISNGIINSIRDDQSEIIIYFFNYLIKKNKTLTNLDLINNAYVNSYRYFNYSVLEYLLDNFKPYINVNDIYLDHNIMTWACLNNDLTLLNISLKLKDLNVNLTQSIVLSIKECDETFIKHYLINKRFGKQANSDIELLTFQDLSNNQFFPLIKIIKSIKTDDIHISKNKNLYYKYLKNPSIIYEWRHKLYLSTNAAIYNLVNLFNNGYFKIKSINYRVQKSIDKKRFFIIMSKLHYDLHLFICNLVCGKYFIYIDHNDINYHKIEFFQEKN